MAKTGAKSLCFEGKGLAPLWPELGMLCRVIDRPAVYDRNITRESSGLKKGDLVRIIKIYPNVVLAEKVSYKQSEQRYQECFTRRCMRLTLKPVDIEMNRHES